MKTIPFSIDEWKNDETRRVIDNNGETVEIVRCGLSPQFFSFLPEGVDPTTCYTYHLHRNGSKHYPVLGAGIHENLFIVEK